MKNVVVVGAGFMGAGIAQVCAQSGYNVFLADTDQGALDKAVEGLSWSLEKLAQKGFLSESPQEVKDRISFGPDYSQAAGKADYLIEAVLEVEEIKLEVFKNMERLARKDTLIATNTSSIPITRLARVMNHPERVLGLHFFGPVPFMGLVEVVKGEETSEDVFEQGVEFVRSLGKTPVKVRRDIPMFVMNRIFAAAFSEALDLVAEGVCTTEDVDVGMRLGYGWNVGPFEIADNAGLDTYNLILRTLKSLGEDKLFPGPGASLIEDLVNQGRLGKKSGSGFYEYGPDGKKK